MLRLSVVCCKIIRLRIRFMLICKDDRLVVGQKCFLESRLLASFYERTMFSFW
jgi:hypothetical protein